jgi:parvulin-like peptidyl-prolyl isomerase
MKLLSEPLLHFAIAGALLFGAYAWLNRDASSASHADRTIRITERELTWLTDTSARSWQRTPSESEFEGLIAEYLREELLAREARELELDRDDTVVRRRLAQKMNFILEGTARLAPPPTDAELRARYDADPSRFRTPIKSSFRQVYFSTGKRGDRAATDALRAFGRLASRDRVDAAELGDASLLPRVVTDSDEQTIAGQFGAEFAQTVVAIAPGVWQGPIQSEFGQHLVLVTARDAGRPRAFDEVRAELLDEWRREQEVTAKNAYFARLLRKYDVQATESTQHLLGPAMALLQGAEQ